MSKNIFGSSSLVKLISLIKNTIDSKYTKPSTGIPKTDLASSIQTSLGKADTALQSYTEKYTGTYTKPDRGIPKTDLANSVQATLDKADTALQSYTEIYTGTYSKPSTGIPKTDLASSVQTSLGKADTALQSHQDISGKQDKSDNSLATTSKTVVGAINEINEKDKSTTINGISSVINVTTDNKLAEIVNLKGLSNKSANILDRSSLVLNKQLTSNGQAENYSGRSYTDEYFEVKASTTYTISPKDYVARVCCYDASKTFIGVWSNVDNTKSGYLLFDTIANTKYIRVSFGADVTNINIMINEGNSPLPYQQAKTIDSNPIVEAKSVGKNLVDKNKLGNTTYKYSDGSVLTNAQYYGTLEKYPIKANQDITLKCTISPTDKWVVIVFYDANGNYQRNVSAYAETVTAKANVDGFVSFEIYAGTKADSTTVSNVQLEYGNVATSYVPYNADTLSIIPTESREKLISMGYGMGINADVNNGIFFKQTYRNMKSIDLGTLGWVYNSANAIFYSTTDVGIVTSTNTTANILCDKYAYEDVEWSSHSNKTIGVRKNLYLSDVVSLVVKDTSYTSVSDFKSAMSGVIARCECADNSGQEYKAIVYKKKCASRSYQSGDESNTNYLTDGSTTTIYPLTTEQIYDVTDLLHSDNILSVEKGGTITLIDSSGVAKSVPSTITILGNADATVRLNEIVRGNETEDADNSIIGDSWTSSKTYTVGEYAISGDKLWKCKVQNTNTIPSEGTYWKCVSVTDVLTPTVVTRTWTNGFYKMVNNNGIVTITMNLVTPSTMMALTDEFKPKNDMFLPLIDLNTHQYVYLYITSSGTISVHTISQSQLSDYKLYGSVTYHTF